MSVLIYLLLLVLCFLKLVGIRLLMIKLLGELFDMVKREGLMFIGKSILFFNFLMQFFNLDFIVKIVLKVG